MSAEVEPAPAAAIVVAAGEGSRAGQAVPKQFAPWRGKPVVRHSVEALSAAGLRPLVVVIPAGREAMAREALAGILGLRFISGGATRQESVRAGLEALAVEAPLNVLIHDAARPDLPRAIIDRLLAALTVHPAAIPVLPVIDSLARADGEL
ncbi:MAG: 2-C-methyl-D-erythritol 4-phosphate cytidylyltransferase, partial [Novosphingobium sp.]|nr:2-C-methyl-D-erythritol 4-phosphate cytidylyltransferase [Novosphingobium sp.]